LHSDVFEIGVKNTPASSRSLVPTAYAGIVDLGLNDDKRPLKEISYDILNRPVDWQKGHSYFRVLKGQEIGSLPEYFRRRMNSAKERGLNGYVVAIDRVKVMEYLNFEMDFDAD